MTCTHGCHRGRGSAGLGLTFRSLGRLHHRLPMLLNLTCRVLEKGSRGAGIQPVQLARREAGNKAERKRTRTLAAAFHAASRYVVTYCLTGTAPAAKSFSCFTHSHWFTTSSTSVLAFEYSALDLSSRLGSVDEAGSSVGSDISKWATEKVLAVKVWCEIRLLWEGG